MLMKDILSKKLLNFCKPVICVKLLNFVIMRNNTTCLPDAALLRYLARLSAVEHVSAKPDDLAAAAALKLDKGGLLEKSTGSDCVSDLDLPEGLAAEGEVTDFEWDEGKLLDDDE